MSGEILTEFMQKDAMCEVCLKKYAVFRCLICGKCLCINCAREPRKCCNYDSNKPKEVNGE
jgi:hypothetical protein